MRRCGKKHVQGATTRIPQDFVCVADAFKRSRRTVGRILLHFAKVRLADPLIAGIRQNSENLSRIFV
jgi:hypothetical protein